MAGIIFQELDRSSMFTPDGTDVFNYFETLRSARLQPEKKLMLAILEDAIKCLKEPKLKPRAEGWIMSEEKQWIFSFENICDTLGFNPDYLLKGLRAYIE